MDHVDSSALSKALQGCASDLTRRILPSAMREEDSRFRASYELLISAVWKGFWELPGMADRGTEVLEIDLEVSDLIRHIEGRTLTVLEGIFPPGQQCEALKSQTHQRVWQIWQDVVSPQEEGPTVETQLSEVQRLANWLMKNFSNEIGAGDPKHGESAVDVAIRLLQQLKDGLAEGKIS